MRKIFTLAAAAMIAAGAMAAEKVIVMDLNNTTVPETLTFGDNNAWADTYNDEYSYIECPPFLISHIYENSSWGGSYWDGFTISCETENANHDGNYLSYQFSSVPGGGVEDGEPFLVGYWGWYDGDDEARSNHIIFNDGNTYDIKGVYVTNSTWPYYGCQEGDGFARAFDQEGDSFKLIAHGVHSDATESTAEIELIGYHNGQFSAIDTWEWWDLTALGNCEKVYFTMTSTDSGQYGINTAKYFCLSKFTIATQVTGIDEVNTAKQVQNVKYVNINGMESSTPFQGLNVKVTTYTDGTRSTAKIVK